MRQIGPKTGLPQSLPCDEQESVRGTPRTRKLGSFSITELTELRGAFGLPVERDLHFKAECRIGEYADRGRRAGTIRA